MDRMILQQQLVVQTDADKKGLFTLKDTWRARLVTLYNDRITLHKGTSSSDMRNELAVLTLDIFKSCHMVMQGKHSTIIVTPTTSLSHHHTLSLRAASGCTDDDIGIWCAKIAESISNRKTKDWSVGDGIADATLQAHMQRASMHAQHRRQGSKEHRKSASIYSEPPQSPKTTSGPTTPLQPVFDISEILSSFEARDMAVHDAFSASFFNTSPRASAVRGQQQQGKENYREPVSPTSTPQRPKMMVVSRPVNAEAMSRNRDSGASFGSQVSDSKRNSAHEATIYAVDEYTYGSSPLPSPLRARLRDSYRHSRTPSASSAIGLGLNVL